MHLTNLDQSKKLKEWGAPQDTTYFVIPRISWNPEHENKCEYGSPIPIKDMEDSLKKSTYYHRGDHVAAYDLESLIGWLGDSIYKGDVRCPLRVENKQPGHWFAFYVHAGGMFKTGKGKTPLEAVCALVEAVKGGK